MPGADPPPSSLLDPLANLQADPLSMHGRLASLEPVRKRRKMGAIFESITLGRLEFVRMPPGRASFWFGHQRMPDSKFTLQIVCEVREDDAPGVDHVASVVTLRRNQVQDAAACLDLLNARLRAMDTDRVAAEDDLVLTAIYLRARPLLDPHYELEYRLPMMPGLLVTVACAYGKPISLRVDQDC